MTALRTALRAPGLILALWLLQVGAAALVALVVAAAAAGAVGPFQPPPDGHTAFPIVELLTDHPGVEATAGGALIITGLGGALFWTLVCPAVILRLGGLRKASELGGRWLSTVVPVGVTSLWHLLIRGGAAIVILTGLGSLPPVVGIPIIVVGAVVAATALDVARVQVVQHGASGLHPRTAALAFLAGLRRPRLLLAVGAAWVLQMGAAFAIAYLAVAGVGGKIHLVAAHGLAVVTVVAGLWRLALVIEAGGIALKTAEDG